MAVRGEKRNVKSQLEACEIEFERGDKRENKETTTSVTYVPKFNTNGLRCLRRRSRRICSTFVRSIARRSVRGGMMLKMNFFGQ